MILMHMMVLWWRRTQWHRILPSVYIDFALHPLYTYILDKVKTERKITYPEARRIVNIYIVPKPNIPCYASTLKVTRRDSSTQAGERQILSPTSVNKPVNSSYTDNRRTYFCMFFRRSCPKTRSFQYHKVGPYESPDSSREKSTISQERKSKT